MNIDWYAQLALFVFFVSGYSGIVLMIKSRKFFGADYVISINLFFLALTNVVVAVVVGYAYWSGNTAPSSIGVVIRPALLLLTILPILILKRLGV